MCTSSAQSASSSSCPAVAPLALADRHSPSKFKNIANDEKTPNKRIKAKSAKDEKTPNKRIKAKSAKEIFKDDYIARRRGIGETVLVTSKSFWESLKEEWESLEPQRKEVYERLAQTNKSEAKTQRSQATAADVSQSSQCSTLVARQATSAVDHVLVGQWS